MKSFSIIGGAPLFGSVTASGSKNAALPIIFATLITKGVCRIGRVPDIGDVRVALELISELGAKVRRVDGDLYVDTRHLTYRDPSANLCCLIRASTYLLGSSLAAFGKCKLPQSGGCNFSPRPIDMHLQAALAFGGERAGEYLTAAKLKGTVIDFPKPSVGATINALIMASVAEGETVIRGYAREPHVIALSDFLISAGADITFTDSFVRIVGRELHGGDVSVIPDMIEAGTYLTAGLITHGRVTVRGCDPNELTSYLDLLYRLGADVTVGSSSATACLTGDPKPVTVTAEPYPGFPTDLQPIAAPLLSFAGGEIYDKVWQSRYGYLRALEPFGLGYSVTADTARIYPSVLHSAHTASPDLRGGMAAILTALMANGESRVDSAETVLRGYEQPTEKLSYLGARISLSDP